MTTDRFVTAIVVAIAIALLLWGIRVLSRIYQQQQEDDRRRAAQRSAALRNVKVLVAVRQSNGRSSICESLILRSLMDAGMEAVPLTSEARERFWKGEWDVVPSGTFVLAGSAERLAGDEVKVHLRFCRFHASGQTVLACARHLYPSRQEATADILDKIAQALIGYQEAVDLSEAK